MGATATFESRVALDGGVILSAEADEVLSIAVVYEDDLTREWAMEVCHRAMHTAESETVHSAWWRSQSLLQPKVLAQAVQAASNADLILISIREAEELSVPLKTWIGAWLERRTMPWGALVALTGRSEQQGSGRSGIREYLRTVASQSHLKFITHELNLPTEPTLYYRAMLAERAQALTAPLAEVVTRCHGRRQGANTRSHAEAPRQLTR